MNRVISGTREHIGNTSENPAMGKDKAREEEVYEPEEPPAADESCAKPTAGGLVARKTLYTFFCFIWKREINAVRRLRCQL
jgi:hypothetical protein